MAFFFFHAVIESRGDGVGGGGGGGCHPTPSHDYQKAPCPHATVFSFVSLIHSRSQKMKINIREVSVSVFQFVICVLRCVIFGKSPFRKNLLEITEGLFEETLILSFILSINSHLMIGM